MKKFAVIFIVFGAAALSVALSGQQKSEMPVKHVTTAVSEQTVVTSDTVLTKGVNVKPNANIEVLKTQIQEDSVCLNELNTQLKNSTDSLTILINGIKKQDSGLLTIATNFLFLPYDSVLISQIAIPAFDAVSTPGAKEKFAIRRTLLANQSIYAKQLYTFLKKQNKRYSSGPTLGRPKSKDILAEFHSLGVYKDYVRYEKWQDTYLGKFLLKIDRTIAAIDPLSSKNVFPSLIGELKTIYSR